MKMWKAKDGRKQSAMERVVRREWEIRLKSEDGSEPSEFQRTIYDPKCRFEIDGFFKGERKALLRPQFRERGAPLELLRRCLEVAFSAALSANNRERIHEDRIPDWEEGQRRAENARAAMDALFDWMSPTDPIAWRKRDKKEAARAICQSVRLATYMDDQTVKDRTVLANSISDALINTREFLKKAPAEYQRHRDSLVSQNPGEPEKMDFIEMLAEGWFFLCGKQHNITKEPFRAFVDAAWEDIGGRKTESPDDGETFSHAIRVTAKGMEERALPDGWRPNWVSIIGM